MISAGPFRKPSLRGLQIGCGRLAGAAVGLDVEAQLLPLDEGGHSRALDGGDVDEYVRAAVVLHDEAVPFLGVEKLNGTLSHKGLLQKTHHGVWLAAQTICARLYPDFACA